MSREFILSVAILVILLAGGISLLVFLEKRKRIRRGVLIAILVIIGVFTLTRGVKRHLTGDDGLRQGGRFGPQAWYQEAVVGGALLIIAAIVVFDKPAKD